MDFGYIAPCAGVIGDFVWYDSNANGLQDAGEPGIPNVGLELRRQSDNALIQVTTTNAAGFYQFTGLCAGAYKVVVKLPPAGLTPSPTNQGGDPAQGQQPESGAGHAADRQCVEPRRSTSASTSRRGSATSCGTTSMPTASRTAASRASRTCP